MSRVMPIWIPVAAGAFFATVSESWTESVVLTVSTIFIVFIVLQAQNQLSSS